MPNPNRYPAGTPWRPTGPGPGRFAPADRHAEEYATPASLEWAKRMRRELRRMPRPRVRALFRDLVRDMDEEPSGEAYHRVEVVRAELARRDREDAKDRAESERVSLEVDRLVAGGMSFNAAWHQVTGQDPEALQARESTVQQLRDEFDLMHELEFLEAVRATNNQLVKSAGRANVDPYNFWLRNSTYVNAHASDEFKEWMARRGGITTWDVFLAQKGRKGTIKDAKDRRRGSMGEWG